LAEGQARLGGIMLELEFGRVDAHHHQPLVLVALVPGLEIRQGAQRVDAGIRPEIDHHHLAAQPPHAPGTSVSQGPASLSTSMGWAVAPIGTGLA
jgi:hypothetical protein